MAVTINQITGEVTLSPVPGFTGTFNLLAGVRAASDPDVESSYDFEPFTVIINPGPTLGPVGNVTTTIGTPVSFALTSTDPNGTGVFYELIDPTTLGTPSSAAVSIDQTTGQVTVTPNPGFTGTLNLVAGVRAIPSIDVQQDYSTQAITLTVNAGPTLGQVSDQSTVVRRPGQFRSNFDRSDRWRRFLRTCRSDDLGSSAACDRANRSDHWTCDINSGCWIYRRDQSVGGRARRIEHRRPRRLQHPSVHPECRRRPDFGNGQQSDHHGWNGGQFHTDLHRPDWRWRVLRSRRSDEPGSRRPMRPCRSIRPLAK